VAETAVLGISKKDIFKRAVILLFFFCMPFYEKPSILIFDVSFFGINFAFKPIYPAIVFLFIFAFPGSKERRGLISALINRNRCIYSGFLLYFVFAILPHFFYEAPGKNTYLVLLVNLSIFFMIPVFIRNMEECITAFWAFSVGALIYSSNVMHSLESPDIVMQNLYGLGLSFTFFMLMFLLILQLIKQNDIFRCASFWLFTVCIWFILLDRSRGCWVGIAVGALFYFVLLSRQIGENERKILKNIYKVSVLALCIFVIFMILTPETVSIFKSLFSWSYSEMKPYSSKYDPLVGYGDNMFIKRLFFFLSFNRTVAWRKVLTDYLPGIVFLGKGINFDLPPLGVHSLYFKTLLSSGLTGLTFLILFVVFIFRRLVFLLRSGISLIEKKYYIIIICSMVSWLTHGITESVVNEFSIWMVLGLAMVDFKECPGARDASGMPEARHIA